MKIINRKAYHDYFIDDTLECGIVLKGNEVKSIREGSASIKNAWVRIQGNQLVLRGMQITAWKTSNKYDIDEDRERVLLAHKKEIEILSGKLANDCYTLVPLSLYFNKQNKCKIELGICRGKKLHDKRQVLKEKQVRRDIDREMKGRY